jgi:DNA-binding transcriptional LysR family regulator
VSRRNTLDDISLDHLEVFIACARAGSFSGAARALDRTQSMISHAIARFESHLGVALFERNGRLPVLTAEGRALLADARVVSKTMESFRARARSLSQGSELEVSIVMSAFFPAESLTRAVGLFRGEFSQTPLQLRVEPADVAMRLVIERSFSIGVIGSQHGLPDELEVQSLFQVPTVTVVAGNHPLAVHGGPIARKVLDQFAQLACAGWSTPVEGQDEIDAASQVWKLSDLGMKQDFIRAGFGWGHMPLPMVKADIAQGVLAQIDVEASDTPLPHVELITIHRRDAPPGIAGGRLLQHLAAA